MICRFRLRYLLRIATASAVAGIVGCEVGPNYQRPKVTTPAAFGRAGPTTGPSTIAATPIDLTQWWTTLGDDQLNALIRRAVDANLDLRRATSRLREARARRAIASGGQYPRIDANTGYTHERLSKNAQPFASVSGGGLPFEYDLFNLGFDASWELDVFGGTRRAVRAADLDLAAGVEDRRAVLLSVIAEVARNYVELRGYQRQLDVAEQNLAVQRETVAVTKDQQANGVVTQLDVSRASAQASATEAELPAIENREWQAIHRLAVLVGEEPNALSATLAKRGPIPVPPNSIPVGLPSELLRRRPDVRRAERQLAAGSERIGAAIADLYPKFSLNGSVGVQSSEASSLFDYGSRTFSFGPSLSIPIFEAGRLRAAVDVRTAQQEQALAAYQQSVLDALREVEDAIVALQTEERRAASLRDSVNAYREAAELARGQYRQGLTDFLTVLESERNLFVQEDALAHSEQTTTTSLIALYKALGGGWEAEANAVPIAAATH